MRKLSALLAAILLALGLGLLVPGSANASSPYCGIYWGSLLKSDAGMSTARITNVRSGQHPCFDRLVVDLNGRADGYTVRYVKDVTSPGSGLPVYVQGGARIQVTVNSWAAPSFAPRPGSHLLNLTGYSTFRDVVYLRSFEGYTDLGLGVRAHLPFRVFTLDGSGSGSRVVIGVARFW